MIVFFWNCQGLGQVSTVRTFREYCNSHRPVLVFLSEVKVDNLSVIQDVTNSLKMENSSWFPQGEDRGVGFVMEPPILMLISLHPQLISFLF